MAQDTRQQTEHRDFAAPDEVRPFSHGRLEILRVGGSEIGRLILQPGWRWSQDVKPIAGTELCEAPHFQYHVSGTLRVRTADGAEFERHAGAGDLAAGRARRMGRRGRGGRRRRLVGSQQLRQVSNYATARAAAGTGSRGPMTRTGQAYFCTSVPTAGSAAFTCLTALPRTVL